MTAIDNLCSIVVYCKSIVSSMKEHKYAFILKIKKSSIYSSIFFLLTKNYFLLFSSRDSLKLFWLTLVIHRWCVMIELIYDLCSCVPWAAFSQAESAGCVSSLQPSHFTLNASWRAEMSGNNPSNIFPPRLSGYKTKHELVFSQILLYFIKYFCFITAKEKWISLKCDSTRFVISQRVHK